MAVYRQLKVCVPNRELTAAARTALCGHWLGAVGVMLLAIALALVPIILPAAAKFVTGTADGTKGLGLLLIVTVLATLISCFSSLFANLALPHYFLTLFDGGETDPRESFGIAIRRFATYVWAVALAALIIFLKFFLLIVPGILAAFDYAMVIWCLIDDPELRPGEALKRSRAIMHGHRWQLFCLTWRFFGWFLLSLLTLGIGFLWLIPYGQTACAAFYRSIMPAKDDPLYAELPEVMHRPYSAALNKFWLILWILLSIFGQCMTAAAEHFGLLPGREHGVKTVSAPTLDEE